MLSLWSLKMVAKLPIGTIRPWIALFASYLKQFVSSYGMVHVNIRLAIGKVSKYRSLSHCNSALQNNSGMDLNGKVYPSLILGSRCHAHFVWKLVIVINYFSHEFDHHKKEICMYFLGYTCPSNFLLNLTENVSEQGCHGLTEQNLCSIQWISGLLHHFPLHSRASIHELLL